MHVTYHPPRVERLWVQHGEYRVFLHRIHPCGEGEALFHPHPWPSAVRIMSGRYEHQIAQAAPLEHSGPDQEPVPDDPLARMILCVGSEYEITDPRTWHSVRPVEGPSDSIMVVGPKYDPPVTMPKAPREKQGPLSQERFDELFDMWHDRVDGPVECGTCGWSGRHSGLASFDGESPHARCPECMDEDQVYSLDRRTA